MQVYTQVNNDPPIEQDIISTVVTLHENGLPICHLIANNYKGKLYLQTLKLFSTVTVKFAYEDNGTINWDNVEPVFRGKIVEIGPEMSSRGETLVATAVCGELLKQARVNKEYLAGLKEEISISGNYDVNGWVYRKNDWTHVNSQPWLHIGDNDYISVLADVEDKVDLTGNYYVNDYEYVVFEWTAINNAPWLQAGDGDKICVGVSNNDIGRAIGDFKFADLPCLKQQTYLYNAKLKIRGRLYDGVNGHASSARIEVSFWNGYVWTDYYVTFDSTSWSTKELDLISILFVGKFNEVKIRLKLVHVEDGGPTKGGIIISEAYIYLHGHTWDNKFPEDGDYTVNQIVDCDEYVINELTLNVRGRMSVSGVSATVQVKVYDGTNWSTFGDFKFGSIHWTNKTVNVIDKINIANFNNIKIAVVLADSSNNDTNASIDISAVWFWIKGVGRRYYHNTLRNIIQDIKNDCLDRLLGEQVTQPEDYKINVDYVYNWDKDYPYMNFPFTDGLYCLNELVKIGCSMRYVKDGVNYRGLHWIVTPNNQLVIAPVGDHGVYGANNSCYIEDVWETYCPLNPIIVKEDMIQAQFKTEIPLANVVLVAGKFVHPKDDVWTERLNGWSYDWKHMGGFTNPTVNLMLNNTVVIKGSCSLCFRINLTWDNRVWAILYRPLIVDFSKLVSKNINAYVNLQIYGKMKGEEIKLRLYCNNDSPKVVGVVGGYAILGSYFEYDLSQHLPSSGIDKWHKIEIPVTYNDLTDVTKEGVWTAHNDAGYEPPSWSKVKWFVIYIKTNYCIYPLGTTDEWLFDDICVVGNVVRGAYTSDCGFSSIDDCKIGCIKHYGIRTYTIKDSLAQTDSLDPNDDNNTLAQVALYELLRHRVPRTTATIQVPLYPSIKAGQIVHIKYNQLEDGSYVIDREFRITKVTHQFSSEGAKTILEITDDVRNSLPINTTDPFTVLLRAVNPDTQTKTFASLKHEGTFITGINILWKQYNK